jgi:predicted transcriptional regulator
MKFPCEIIVWEVLPCIRAALAKELVKKGLSQNEISKMLGITQAAVSHYTSKKRGSRITFSEDAKEEIKKLADDLVNGKVDNLVVRICTICLMIRADEAVCALDLCITPEKK